MSCRLVILECNGESHPAICFNLEIARCETRIVFDTNEALNLMEIAQQTGAMFDSLLVNNPGTERTVTRLVEQGAAIGAEIPIVFVSQSDSMRELVSNLSEIHPSTNLYFCKPAELTALVLTLIADHKAKINDLATPGNCRDCG